jgi:hypothetical protein
MGEELVESRSGGILTAGELRNRADSGVHLKQFCHPFWGSDLLEVHRWILLIQLDPWRLLAVLIGYLRWRTEKIVKKGLYFATKGSCRPFLFFTDGVNRNHHV